MARIDAGTTAARTLTEELYGLVHFRAAASMRSIRGISRVRVNTRTRKTHEIEVELQDGTTRNFTVQIIEHH